MSDADGHQPRRRLYPDQLEPVALYYAPAVLDAALATCRQRGWSVVELDAGRWDDVERFHDDVATAFGLPRYYGRNLDALGDCLGRLAVEGGGVGAGPGLAVVLHHLDQLLTLRPQRATAVAEILADTTRLGLQYGWPLAVLLHSDDPDLEPLPLTVVTASWNRAEFRRSDRG